MVSPSDFFNEVYLRNYFMSNLLQKKGGGRDHLSPEKYLEIYGDDFEMIAVKCLEGTYRFSYFNEKLVLKGSNKLPRVLSVPTIRDRLVLGVLNDYLSSVFSDCVCHEIPNSHIYKVEDYVNSHSGRQIEYLRTDFHDFYGTLSISLLLKTLRSRIRDKSIIKLVSDAVTTPTFSSTVPKGQIRKKRQGIPQGLSISNILASIYMMPFDQEFGKNSSGLYIRYVDDILFLDVDSAELSVKLLDEIKRRKLRLRLSKEKCKSGIIGKDSLDFIGYIIKDKIFIRQKNVTRFLDRVAAMSSKCKDGWIHPYQRPLFIQNDDSFIGYYVEEFNRLISGFKYGNRLYGWLPYFQAINDVSSLYGMDYVIKHNLLYGLPPKLISKVKSLVDTYFDIRRHGGRNMVADYDSLKSVDERKSFLADKGRLDINKSYSDEQINNYFESYMDMIRRVSEQNIGETS